MAGANSNIKLVGTDFDQIKGNILAYLRDQNILKDADYTGSALSTLLDILAYNTHYNSYYLNMAVNEMFLDTAIKRSSVVSHAKLLGYSPKSYSCPSATVSVSITGLQSSSFVIPKFSRFISEKIDEENYSFITDKEYFVSTDINGDATINNVVIKEGRSVTYTFSYNSVTNPSSSFVLPDENIDISTIQVIVQRSSTNQSVEVFRNHQDSLSITPETNAYFIEENYDGKFKIYFGNGIIGKSLTDGNIVLVTYLTTEGNSANKAANFSLIDTPQEVYTSLTVETLFEASLGSEKESTESIRYLAPKVFSSQGRAVTVNDYKALIKRNSSAFPIDVINVWSGEENDPPVYGKIFVCIKPSFGYSLTQNQKTLIIEDVIKPISVMTVSTEIVDVDYTFVKFEASVLVDKNKTLLSDQEIRARVVQDIKSYASQNLNSFDSTIYIPNYISSVNQLDSSILTNEQKVYLQKRIYPIYQLANSYKLNFGVPIKKDIFGSSISFGSSVKYRDPGSNDIIREEVFLEQTPSNFSSIESIEVTNEGFNYTSAPAVTILGDGEGATAEAIVENGKLKSIVLTNAGKNYTQALVTITGGNGLLATAKPILSGQSGILRTYYYIEGVKTILNSNIGSVDYLNGIVILDNFSPISVNNTSGTLSINIIPETNIINSKKNSLLTLDESDNSSITVNVIRK